MPQNYAGSAFSFAQLASLAFRFDEGAKTMLRPAAVFAFLGAVLVNMPAFAITEKQKLETCTFGANNQKLTGNARKDFITKCMADEAAPQQQK